MKFNRRYSFGGDVLFIIMPPRPNKYMHRNFKRNCIQVMTPDNTWGVNHTLRDAKLIKKEIELSGYKRVCFTGASKSGFAAILMPLVLSSMLPHIEFDVIAWSPCTYVRRASAMYKQSHSPEFGRMKPYDDSIDTFGDLMAVIDDGTVRTNVSLNIVLGDGKSLVSRGDFGNALRLSSCPYLKIFPIDLTDVNIPDEHLVLKYLNNKLGDGFYDFIDEILNIDDSNNTLPKILVDNKCKLIKCPIIY